MNAAQGGTPTGADPASHSADNSVSGTGDEAIVVGKIAAPFGVQGWTKVVSYTEPTAGLLEYSNWQITKGKVTRTVEVQQGREHGKFLVVKFKGVADRDQAALLTNAEIKVTRDEFPDTETGQYYWADLIGLKVVTTNGVALGVIDSMLETGANDVLVVKGDRERLVPWIVPDVVTKVDMDDGSLTVDWDPDF